MALARHQVAAKLATQEKWRTIKLDRAAGAVGARLEARQSMATQQEAAIDTMRLRARANSVKGIHGAVAVPPNPREAVAAWREIARANHDDRVSIRRRLNEQRAGHYRRAAEYGRNGKGQTQDRSRAVTPQDQARQAVMSGRPLTDAERLNASPEVRESLGCQDRRARERSVFAIAATQQQRGNGGRQGGGRGR